MNIKLTVLLAASMVATLTAQAPKTQPAYTSITEAGADYAVQGEYTGKWNGSKAGLQIIAQGDGKFSAVLYPGGLPGDGWSGDKATRKKGAGSTSGGMTTLTVDGVSGTIAGGKAVLGSNEFTRTERKSPTIEAKAPAGAVVLFDGTDTTAWNGNGMTAEKLLKQGQNSKQNFGSYSLHLEFMLPFQPLSRGQGRGNSGVYNQSRYEVQVLDSFGLDGENNECGGIYTIATPSVNMCFPPLQWQTYDIDYTAAVYDAGGKKTANARVTVKHNGVVVQNNTELTHNTTASPLGEGPEPGPLHLQDHGNPVRYRNIWIIPR